MLPFKKIAAILGFLCGACTHAPMQVDAEKRYHDSFWGGFSERVVTASNLVGDGQHGYFGTRTGKVIAFDLSTGKTLWKRKLKGEITTSVLVDEGKLFVGTAKGKVHALEAASGKSVWEHEVPGEVIGTPSKIGTSAIVFGVNDGTVYAVERDSGKRLWNHRRPLPDRITIRSTAAAHSNGDRVYAAFADGTLVALRTTDGSEIWRYPFPTQERFPDIVAPILTSGDRVIAVQYFGSLYMVGGDGRPIWSFDEAAGSTSVLVRDDDLFIPATQNRIVRALKSTGERKWVADVGQSATWSGLTVFDRYLLAATYEGNLHQIDLETGKLVWKYSFGAPIQGAPLVAGNRVWVVIRDGKVYALRL